MKKIVLFIFVLISTASFATQIRVNGNPEMLAPYTDLQLAIDEATDGDTIMVEGVEGGYGGNGLTVDKQLMLIGTGYLLDSNSQTQQSSIESLLGSISLNSGSEGSMITGFVILGQIYVTVPNTAIIKNKGWNYNSSITLNDGAFNTLVEKNFEIKVTTLTDNCSAIIQNNLQLTVRSDDYDCALTIRNNTLGYINVNYSLIYNNILFYGGDIPLNIGNSFQNNLFYYDQQGLDPTFNNLTNIEMGFGSFFVGGSGDSRWQLIPGTVAEGAGLNGEDCGAFGGANPYVLSGMPSEVPSIYDLSTSGAGAEGNQIQFNIKAKTHN